MKHLLYVFITFLIFSCQNENKENKTDNIIIESDCDSASQIPFELEPILTAMETKLNDSLWSNYWIHEHNSIINDLKSYHEDGKQLFPYSRFDSTVFILDKPEKTNNIITLCSLKANALLNVINDPRNYSIGECATAIPFSKVCFYFENKKVGELTFACGYSSVYSIPENPMVFGNLNKRGDSLLRIVKPWN